jgi:hypothetical protein
MSYFDVIKSSERFSVLNGIVIYEEDNILSALMQIKKKKIKIEKHLFIIKYIYYAYYKIKCI